MPEFFFSWKVSGCGSANLVKMHFITIVFRMIFVKLHLKLPCYICMTYDVKDQEKVSKYHSFMEQCSRLEFSSKDFICSNLLNSKKVAPVSHNSCFFFLFFLFFSTSVEILLTIFNFIYIVLITFGIEIN